MSEATTPTTGEPYEPGWYKIESHRTLRYHDGEKWTDSYAVPASELDDATAKDILWGLSLGFGATGGTVAAVGVPVLAFYFPLGFGMGGAVLAAAAIWSEGRTPWWAALAVLASLVALFAGVEAYNEFQDASNDLRSVTR